jgi:transposase
MHDTTLVGIDLGKHSFHLHGQSDSGKQTLRKKVTRKQLLEFFVTAQACAGAHYMARTLAALGHTVKLISPQFVKPFAKSNKNDFVDAEAICEAAVRPAMQVCHAEDRSTTDAFCLTPRSRISRARPGKNGQSNPRIPT